MTAIGATGPGSDQRQRLKHAFALLLPTRSAARAASRVTLEG